MVDKIREELFVRFEQIFGQLNTECWKVNNDDAPEIGSSLVVSIPVPGMDGRQFIMEIALAELGERMNFLQFYTTIVMELNQITDEHLQVINEINFCSPVGFFGIFSEKRQLYHKSTLVFDDEAGIESMASDALLTFHAILMILELHAPMLEKLAMLPKPPEELAHTEK